MTEAMRNLVPEMAEDDRPLKELLTQLWGNLETLVRQELALARAEMESKIARARSELIGAALAFALFFAAFLTLIASIILLLGLFVPAWLAALMVTALSSGAGYALLMRAKKRRDSDQLMPSRVGRGLEKDIEMLEEVAK